MGCSLSARRKQEEAQVAPIIDKEEFGPQDLIEEATLLENFEKAKFYTEVDLIQESDSLIQKLLPSILFHHPDNKDLLAQAYDWYGRNKIALGEYQASKEHLTTGLNLRKGYKFHNSKDKEVALAESYHSFGILYYELKEYDKAIEYFMDEYTILSKEIGDDDLQTAYCCQMIGNYYTYKQNFYEASMWYTKALKAFQTQFNKNLKATGHLDIAIGRLLIEQKDYKFALKYLYRAKQTLGLAINDEREDQFETLRGGNPKHAEPKQQQIQSFPAANFASRSMFELAGYIGECLYRLGSPKKSIEYFSYAYEGCKKAYGEDNQKSEMFASKLYKAKNLESEKKLNQQIYDKEDEDDNDDIFDEETMLR